MTSHPVRPRILFIIVPVLIIAGGLALFFVSRDDESPPPKYALVSTVVNNPRVNVFYGRSCSGTPGPWFLNIVQGGGTNVVHVEFYLRWQFTGKQRTAVPDGRVVVAGGPQPPPTISLDHGNVTVKGSRPDGSPVTGSGRLEVRLSGTNKAPTIMLVETGLDDVYKALGIASPFQKDAKPVIVPVKWEDQPKDCPTA